MIKDFFGLLKMVLSVVLFLIGCTVVFSLLQTDFSGQVTAKQYWGGSGIVLGYLLTLLFAGYLFYSGWTEFRGLPIKRPIVIWFGVLTGLVSASFCIFSQILVGGMLGLVFFTISLQEVIRMLKKSSNPRNEAST
jgi:hypothetical protein